MRNSEKHIGLQETTATSAGAEKKRCRILIVEDNRAIVRAIQLLLEHEGYETRWCEDDTLYSVIQEWKPDLILMDLRMPNLDGRVATRIIKSDPSTCSIPVILITAEQVTPDHVASIQANELVPKPFRIAQLLERIRYWISRHTTSERDLGSSMQSGLSHAL